MKFKINNTEWEIKEQAQKEIQEALKRRDELSEEKGKYFGVTLFDTHNIYLDKDLCLDRKRRTLLHELGHCYIGTYITHIDKEYREEEVVDIISNSHDIIREIVDRYFQTMR